MDSQVSSSSSVNQGSSEDECHSSSIDWTSTGIKKSIKRKVSKAEAIKAIREKEEQNERMIALLEKSNEIRSRKLEDSILLADTSTITDPLIRSCIIQWQIEITEKKE